MSLEQFENRGKPQDSVLVVETFSDADRRDKHADTVKVANQQVENHRAEIEKLVAPQAIASAVGQFEKDTKLTQIARDIKKGPSRSVSGARFKPGSHTELQTSTTGSSPLASEAVFVDALGQARVILGSHGELSASFFEQPLTRGVRTRTSHKLDAVHRALGVPPEDRSTWRETVCKADSTAIPIVNRPNSIGLVSPATRDIAELAIEGLRWIKAHYPLNIKPPFDPKKV